MSKNVTNYFVMYLLHFEVYCAVVEGCTIEHLGHLLLEFSLVLLQVCNSSSWQWILLCSRLGLSEDRSCCHGGLPYHRWSSRGGCVMRYPSSHGAVLLLCGASWRFPDGPGTAGGGEDAVLDFLGWGPFPGMLFLRYGGLAF